MINEVDREALREQVRSSEPFPFFYLDNFLEESFAREVEASFPPLDEARELGHEFKAVNERNKIQIQDSSKFQPSLQKLNEVLASPEWRELVADVMGIPGLSADPDLIGGGIHETSGHGHLDVHVDFNYVASKGLYRRVNILVYFNSDWREEWGGNVELWDADVKNCVHSFQPVFNRCVVFATSDISFHGVTAVTCPDGKARKSFAAYYYTPEPFEGWQGEHNSTVFKARPNEHMKAMLMPLERLTRLVGQRVKNISKRLGAD